MTAIEEKRETHTDFAYNFLKRGIISGQIPSGTMISEVAIAKVLNMSRTPIREALKMLKAEDLVKIRVGVGTFVNTFTQKDIEDAYEVRKALEILSIQSAINNFSEKELDQLEKRFFSIQQRINEESIISIDEFLEADWYLHNLIIQKSENRYVKSIMEKLGTILWRYQSFSVHLLSHTAKTVSEHLQIINFIRTRKLNELKVLLEHHIKY